MSWADFEIEVGKRMTTELAHRVKLLRDGNNLSWRGVSQEVFNHSEAAAIADWMEMRGHQPLGMYLCAAAAAHLGENWD